MPDTAATPAPCDEAAATQAAAPEPAGAMASALPSAEADQPIFTYDLRGLKCPLPVLRARKRMATLAPGTRLAVETTDPMSVIDIPHFCRKTGICWKRR